MELLLSSRTAANAAARHCLRLSGSPGRLIRAGKGYRHRGETRRWFLEHPTLSETQTEELISALPFGALLGRTNPASEDPFGGDQASPDADLEWEAAERAIDHQAKEEARYLRPDTEEVTP